MNRQPLILAGMHQHHWYDEDVDRRETVGACRIVWHCKKQTRRPTKWQVGVIANDVAQGDEYWVGGITYRGGRYNAYLRGPRGTELRFEMTGFRNEADAVLGLRWAISQLYP